MGRLGGFPPLETNRQNAAARTFEGIIQATDAANGNGALDVDSRYVKVDGVGSE